jgi:hypothetical protein
VSWDDLNAAYRRAEAARARADDPVSLAAADFMVSHLARPAGMRNESRPTAHRRTDRRAEIIFEQRAAERVTKLSAVLECDPRGASHSLASANRWGGFDWFRDNLEVYGFARAAAWWQTLALRRRKLILSEPNRPFLDRSGLALARRLLSHSAFHSNSAHEWEVFLMLGADSVLGQERHPARLDAELVTIACADLAASMTSRVMAHSG